MPALFIVLGIAVVVFIAAAGHHKHPHHDHPSAGTVVELDRGMPPSVVLQVLTALGEENDPARLEDLASSLAAYYPLAAGELRTKALSLRPLAAAPHPGALPAATPGPTTTPNETHPPPAAEAPALRQLDAAAVLQAAMRALVDETDPVVLEGFAESIRGPYPAAADILAARAQTLRTSAKPAIAASETAEAEPAPSTTATAPTPEERP